MRGTGELIGPSQKSRGSATGDSGAGVAAAADGAAGAGTSKLCEKCASLLSTAFTSSVPCERGTKPKVSAGSELIEISDSACSTCAPPKLTSSVRMNRAGVYIRVTWFICMPLKFG